MLTYTELLDLRRKLANCEITLEKAKESYWQNYKEGQRSWHTKDWKERRDIIIKDKCEICDSKETLTLQHRSHPNKYYEYEKDVTRKYTQSSKIENDFYDKAQLKEYISKKYTYEPVSLCPKCGSRKPNIRISKTPKFLCITCHEVFDEPMYKSIEELISLFYENELAPSVKDKCFVTKDVWNNKHNFKNIKYWMYRDLVKTTNLEIIEKEAFLLYLEDNIKYLSFSDTITACKMCASYFDLYNMELCPNCKKYCKGVHYKTCIQCLPEEKRKAALGKIQFGKDMQSMEEELGID